MDLGKSSKGNGQAVLSWASVRYFRSRQNRTPPEIPKRMQVTAINAHGETEALELRCFMSPVGDSFNGLASRVVAFLVKILIVGRHTLDLGEEKPKPGLHGLPNNQSPFS